MASFIRSFFQRVIHIQISGKIDVKQANRIYSGLETCHKYSVPAIVLSINSQGGCLTQAKNISAIVRHFSQKKLAPVYCFAEDMCLNSANQILTCGKDSYASRLSILGDFGYCSSTLGLKQLFGDWKVRYNILRGGTNKATLNPLEDLSEKDKQWIQNYLYSLQHQLRVSIIKNRASQFQRHQLTRESIESDIFQKNMLIPEEAVKLGFIDGISTVDDFLSQKFKGVKVKKINPPKAYLARLQDIKNIVQDF